MVHCARHLNCSAINFWSMTGTCELLPGIGDCAETIAKEGSTFVHLRDCSGRSSWEVERRNWSTDATCLTWEPHDATKDTECNSRVLRGPNRWYCVVLIPHKGLYLPGWYRSHQPFHGYGNGSTSTLLGCQLIEAE